MKGIMAIAATALALAAFCAGCAGAGHIVGAAAALAPQDNSAEFLDAVSSRSTVSENQALMGILLLTDGKDDCRTFQQRVSVLAERKIVDGSWDFAAGRPITRGRLAYMLYRACRMRGGLILTLAGPSRRYCLRELQYQGLMADGLPDGNVTGMEFVAVLARADKYIRTGEADLVGLAPAGGGR